MPGKYLKSVNPLSEYDNRERLAPVISDKLKSLSGTMDSPGKRAYVKHLTGDVLTRTEAINAMCYVHQGFNACGKCDCCDLLCPLYPFMPYGVRLREIRRRQREKRLTK